MTAGTMMHRHCLEPWSAELILGITWMIIEAEYNPRKAVGATVRALLGGEHSRPGPPRSAREEALCVTAV